MVSALSLALCVLVAAACAHAQTLTDCYTSFNQTFASQDCSAFHELGACLTSVIQAAVSDDQPAEALVASSKQIIAEAVFQNQDVCDLSAVPYLANVAGTPDNLALSAVQGASIVMPTYKRAVVGPSDIKQRTQKILAMRDAVLARVGEDVVAADAAIVRAADNYVNIVHKAVDLSVADINSRFAGYTATMNTLQTSMTTTLPNAVSTAQAALTVSLNAETGARMAMSTPLANLLASIDAAVAPAVAPLVTDRSSMRASTPANTIASGLSTSLSAAVVLEVSRATAKSANLAAAFAAAQASASTAVIAPFASEAVRANANCSGVATAKVFKLIDRNSTDDYTACSVGGTLYYSRRRKAVLLCNGAFVVPLKFVGPAFMSSTILTNSNLRTAMMSRLGVNSQWVRCFAASVDGFQATMLKGKCANRAPTLSIVTAGGQIWGGFSETHWWGRQNYAFGLNAWLYRFSGTTLQPVPIIASTSYWQYSIYDEPSYCMAYGAGHDFYLDGNCRNGYTSPHSYTASGYSTTYLAGSYSSWSTVDVEMWYRVV